MSMLAANKQGVPNTRSKVCVRRESFGEEDGKRGQNRSISQRSDFILFIFKNATKSKTDGWSACNLHHFRIMWVVNCILFDLDVSRRMCRVIQCLCIKKPGVSDHINAVISPTILIIQQGSNVTGLNLVDSDDRLFPSMSTRAGFKGDAELGELIYMTKSFPLRWTTPANTSGCPRTVKTWCVKM